MIILKKITTQRKWFYLLLGSVRNLV